MRSLALACLLLLACDGKKPTPPPPTESPAMPRLWTDPEVAALETALLARIEANAKRTCKRPLLHGTALPGSATADLIAFAEPTGALASCRQRIATAEQGGKLFELIEQRAPHVIEIANDCGKDIEAAVAAIVRHEDACSPYQTGVRTDPGARRSSMLPAIQGARVVAFHGRLRAEAGDVAAGLRIQLDAIRAAQDLARGQTSFIIAMTANAGESVVLDHVHGVLSTLAVPRDAIKEIDASLAALLASEPPFSDTLRGELDFAALHLGLARMKPASWMPPGGRDSITSDNTPSTDTKLSVQDEAGLMLAYWERMRRDATKACPDGAAFEVCVRELESLVHKLHSAKATMPSSPQELAIELTAKLGDKLEPDTLERSRLEVQRRVVEAFAAEATGEYQRYAAKRARTVARLAAARVHLEAQRIGRCPSQTELDSPAWMALRKPAILGDALAVERTKTHLLLHAPAWTDDGKTTGPVGSIRCD